MKIAHIGLMKSGTTYIQNALAASREKMAHSGMLYPGEMFNQQHACYGICGRDIPWVSPRRRWAELGNSMLHEIRNHGADTLISSEALSSLDSSGVGRFCSQLGGIDCVVITVRNFPKMLLSAWQQSIKGGGRSTLDEFFERLEKQRKKNTGLWRTYAFGQIAARWAQCSKIELIVVDKPSRGTKDPLLATFSRIIGMALDEPSQLTESERNISLLFEDVEVLRHINVLFEKMTRLERERMTRRLLKRLFFPMASRNNGSAIMLPPEYVGKSEEWAQSELEMLPKEISITGNLDHLVRMDAVPVGNLEEVSRDAAFRRFVELVSQVGK